MLPAGPWSGAIYRLAALPGTTLSGCRRPFSAAVLAGRADGHWDTVRPGRSGGLCGVAAGTCAHQHRIPGPGGVPAKPGLVGKQRRTMAGRSDGLPEEPWREVTVARGMPRVPVATCSALWGLRPTSRRKPGEIHWVAYRRNLDGSKPRYYRSKTLEDTPLEALAQVGTPRRK